jgi:hypothetical protein
VAGKEDPGFTIWAAQVLSGRMRYGGGTGCLGRVLSDMMGRGRV